MKEFEDDDILFMPCHKCRSVDYDNADCEDIQEDIQGRIIMQPITCDKCDFSLALSASNELH